MKRRLSRIAAGGAIVTTIMLVCASSASAGRHRYCNSAVPANTPCSVDYTALILLNTAHYDGAGSVSVCERAIVAPSGPQVSRRCSPGASNYIDSDLDIYDSYINYVPAKVTCGNNSSYTHTILCEALYD